MTHEHSHSPCCTSPEPSAAATLDPVCGMTVSSKAKFSVRFQGRPYYFCSASCAAKFNAIPTDYVRAKTLLGTGNMSAVAATTTSMQEDRAGEQRDPICGMRVSSNSPHQMEHAGRTWYFCCAACLAKFRAQPDAALAPAPTPVAPPSNAAELLYICPMDAEVEQLGPGICPLCGMALEPKEASFVDDQSELHDMRRRLYFSIALCLPLLMLSMGDMLPGVDLHARLGMKLFNWLQCTLASPVVLWLGQPFFARAWLSFRSGNLNMFSLIGIGTGAAYLLSLVALLFPAALPDTFKIDGMVPLYFEAAAVIICLVLLGQVLELRARAQTGLAIRSLLALTPSRAIRVNADGSDSDIALDQVQLGDTLRVRPGAQIAVDGSVISGASYVDEAMISGEAMPVAKRSGATVRAGTLNQQGSFTMSAEKIGRDTLLSHIISLVNQAARSRAPIQKLADQVSAWFVPAVLFAALAALLLWYWLGPAPALANGCMAAISVLIIACPCALGLATPISVTVGIGRAAQAGMLIKNAEVLELLEKIDTLVIDKTGTLTAGHAAVQGFLLAQGEHHDQVWALARALEQASEHPLARAIVDCAEQKNIAAATISRFEAVSGQGVRAWQNEQALMLGKPAWITAHGIDTAEFDAQIQTFQANGHAVVILARDQRALALISIADSIKTDAAAALDEVRALGIRVILMSGDNRLAVQSVANKLGIAEFHAEVMPEDKLRMIRDLQAQGHLVAMAGDGINDAPALAQAQVGIAMGSGTDIAMQSADLVLIQGKLQGIARARRLSVATMRNIRQNLFFAFAYNFIGVPLAAGALYPWLGLLLSPMLASAAMSLSSVSVISNALRLRSLTL
ncbi:MULTISPECIES: heavy metal translocating P-type ATPase [unclassified Undibacterium]|uniref:heavy metal translocating P-type ATPase n=1 Tax=unclassified Undibacterium TaxID=2630295 RepID=UPI002AC96D2E|nr:MULTISPECIES: heavy metal translocating P-type ATPase [unclassified Undibacterium]MEB0140285.1 heavy metal translocating P-type ATPase [Undibacterium sp. CCC2.1]MEB0173301.1 heavy metal translocating P-type ATPase [Undibacterium sp. CCC1.1]MEB0177120.1 heavy metal translocating P-type ATPase [Undibacterium sp. CCC3.4]MEB0216424.1 heavy metal translocating P-type ATPase [Undibacterium sp. 5I2]WPX45522.1 heavy metal translocating P-type ATPase [Undibacterium sp. CCC3.4]